MANISRSTEPSRLRFLTIAASTIVILAGGCDRGVLSTIGSGGATATGGSGSGGSGPALGSGGSTGSGGVTGSGGQATGSGGTGTGGTGLTDGGVDVPADIDASMVPAPVQPQEPFPTENQCPDPSIPAGGSPTCPANLADIADWFPTTPAMQAGGGCKPAPHPAGECRFYQLSWQEFLIATQPDLTVGAAVPGKPAFLNWNTIENTFGAGAGQPTPAIPVFGAGVAQDGGRQNLIDQNGHAIYYAVHMNPAFVKFVNDSHLTSADQIVRPEAQTIQFITRAAIVETKEAWQIISDVDAPEAANFITTKAMVPTLSVDPAFGVLAHNDQLRMVTVALVDIHIVHTIPGHPELIWSTFEHANRTTGLTDVAPSALAAPFERIVPPALGLADIDTPNANYLLYARNTPPILANRGVFVPVLNAATQTFTTPATNIYRVFPGSKSRDPATDHDVAATNDAMTTRFNVTTPRPSALDRRPNYKLVGAIWQDVPDPNTISASTGRPGTFRVNSALVNDQTLPSINALGSDSPDSITGGEDRLLSLAMESFTQGEPSFPSCFHCHDTRAKNAWGIPQARQPGSPTVMQPGLINVSHVFFEVVRLNIN